METKKKVDCIAIYGKKYISNEGVQGTFKYKVCLLSTMLWDASDRWDAGGKIGTLSHHLLSFLGDVELTVLCVHLYAK